MAWNRVVFIQMLLLAVASCTLVPSACAVEPSIEDLKARVPSAELRDRPHLCVQIAELQLRAIDKSAADDEKGRAALQDVVTYSELARDYAVQSHRYEKQAEIAVRGMTRKLNDIMHALPHAEQGPLQDAIGRLQRVRDDLLMAMFPKGLK